MSDREQMLIVEDGLKELEIPYRGDQLDMLRRYSMELSLWNKKINLIGDPDIPRRHILDSLTGYHAILELGPRRVCDIGSGAGFPGIPLAIMLEDTSFSLNERMGKRLGFLKATIALLGLGRRVEILDTPVERLRGSFDLLTFRAFKGFPECIPSIAHLLDPEGHILAYQGEQRLADVYRVIDLDYSFLKAPRHLGLMSWDEVQRWMDVQDIGEDSP